MRIGIDVGGTFTDFVLVDDKKKKMFYTKVLTTPTDLSAGVMTGLEKILEIANTTMRNIDYLVHGTTIGTNALIQRKGGKTGLITTEGFIDVLEIGRIQRPKEGLYDFYVENPEPLVPRYLRKGVRERVDAEGNIVTDLDESSVIKVLNYFAKEKVESIAVSLLFSFLNPVHELKIKKLINKILPDVYVSLSCEIAPEFREYERTSTVVINAYLQPIIDRYITNLFNKLVSKYGKIDLRIMQVGGGVMTAESAKGYPVNLVNSGPTGGAVASAYIGKMTKNTRVVSIDMGGTSFDICVIDKGIPTITTEGEFEGYPVKIPVTDVSGIGAGGGSIAWIDKGGILNVGPMSAGSYPGPACYGLGGTSPTVTDANLILGRLNPRYFLGGEMKLHMKLATKSIKTRISDKLGLSVIESAYGIIKIVNANMTKGISVNSTEKGYDLREFVLVAFGGAGPLHATQLAKELKIPKVVIPLLPGNFSAFGLLVADTKHDYVQTYVRCVDDLNIRELIETFERLESQGIKMLNSENVRTRKINWSADMRYQGQSYELNIQIDNPIRTRKDVQKIVDKFHRKHQEIYEYSSKDEKVEFVNLRVTAVGVSPKIKLPKIKKGTEKSSHAIKDTRKVYFEETGFETVNIYDRAKLLANNVIHGPCVIEERMSTTVLIPESKGIVDFYGNIIIDVR